MLSELHLFRRKIAEWSEGNVEGKKELRRSFFGGVKRVRLLKLIKRKNESRYSSRSGCGMHDALGLSSANDARYRRQGCFCLLTVAGSEGFLEAPNG